MARKLNIQFDHAVYDTFTHQHGATLSVNSEKLANLLMAAASATDREAGFFFDTIDGQFVFGFERKREDTHGESRGMVYFELFVTSVNNVEEVPLLELRESLETALVPNFETPPDNKHVRFKYNLNRRAGGSEITQQADPTFIAEAWELYRRDSEQLYLSLDELDSLVGAVDGLFSEVSFVSSVSDDDIDSDSFDVVDGIKSHSDIEVSGLRRRVKKLQQQDQLTCSNLPTYRDVLESKRTEQKESIAPPELTHDIDRIFEDAQEKIKARFQNYPNQGKKLFEQALNNELVEEDTETATDTNKHNRMVYGGLVLAVLVVGFAVGSVSEPLSDLIGASTIVANLVLGALGALFIYLGIYRVGLVRQTDDVDRRQLALDAGIFSVMTLTVLFTVLSLSVHVIPTGDSSSLPIPVLPVTLSIVGFGGTLFGLLTGSVTLVYSHRRLGQERTDTISVIDDTQSNMIDDDAVTAIDEAFQAESDNIDQWIDDQLVEYIRDELHRAAEKHAKESAERTVNGIQTVKESRAYKEAAESERSS